MQFLPKYAKRILLTFLGAVVLMGLQPVCFGMASLKITDVVLDRSTFREGEPPISIRFHLSQAATVRLTIYDARDIAVRTVSRPETLPAGQNGLEWDGNDELGRPVPPEAYFYSLTAETVDGSQVVYDLTDKTGGETVILENVRYDESAQTVRYSVPHRSRVFLRAGVVNAFVIKTLINGAIREKGVYEEPWDGRDSNGVFTVKGHPKFDMSGEGYRLSDNAIIVRPSDDKLAYAPQWIVEGVDLSERRQQTARARGLHRYAYLPVEHSRDVDLRLQFPPHIKRNDQGYPVLSHSVPLTVELPLQEALAIESQRVEVVFFLNNLLIYENEASYFPYTWAWDTTRIPPGEHYLTAFVVSYSGHYGVSIHKVVVDNEQ